MDRGGGLMLVVRLPLSRSSRCFFSDSLYYNNGIRVEGEGGILLGWFLVTEREERPHSRLRLQVAHTKMPFSTPSNASLFAIWRQASSEPYLMRAGARACPPGRLLLPPVDPSGFICLQPLLALQMDLLWWTSQGPGGLQKEAPVK